MMESKDISNNSKTIERKKYKRKKGYLRGIYTNKGISFFRVENIHLKNDILLHTH